MTEEEKLAEEWLDERYLKDMGVRKPCKQAYLAGLKAGSQLDEVWQDYDAGEDCYEDSHEGRWTKRETSKLKWHDLRKDPNDLPEDDRDYLVFTEEFGVEIRNYFTDTKGFSCRPSRMVLAWCEIPKFEV